MPEIKGKLGIDEFYSVIFKDEPISIDEAVIDTVQKSFDFLKEFSKKQGHIWSEYGFWPYGSI